jgi:hypothetical protein
MCGVRTFVNLNAHLLRFYICYAFRAVHNCERMAVSLLELVVQCLHRGQALPIR